jgi:hypothetical protein
MLNWCGRCGTDTEPYPSGNCKECGLPRLLPAAELPLGWQDLTHFRHNHQCKHCRASSRERDLTQLLYVMGAPGYIKVGISNQPCSRLAQARFAYGIPLEMLFVSAPSALAMQWGNEVFALESEVLSGAPFAELEHHTYEVRRFAPESTAAVHSAILSQVYLALGFEVPGAI